MLNNLIFGPMAGALAAPAAMQPPPTAAPQPAPAPSGLDQILAQSPPSDPYMGGVSGQPSVMEGYLPQLNDMMGQHMADYQAARDMAQGELQRQKKSDFWDELTGNVLMPASAAGLPGALDYAMDESKRILGQLHDDRQGRIKHQESMGNLVNNLAKVIKDVDPSDIDNLVKQREIALREKTFQQNQANDLFNNALSRDKFAESKRQFGVESAQNDRSFAQRQKEHADQMSMQAQQQQMRRDELKQQAAAAKAAGDNARANRLIELAKSVHSDSVKSAEAARAARQKALEFAQKDQATASEQIYNAKDGKTIPKHAGYKTRSADEYLRDLTGGDQTQAAPAYDVNALMKAVSGVDRSSIEAEMKRRGLLGKKK